MKRTIAFALVMVLCLGLAACGGPDRQPAIDAFNKAKNAFNEVANIMNADIDSYDAEAVKTMKDMASLLEQHRAVLEGSEELTQEKLDEMIAWYGEVEKWTAEMKAELAALSTEPEEKPAEPEVTPTEPEATPTDPEAVVVDKQATYEAFLTASAAFNEVAIIVNADIESFDAEIVETMTDVSEQLIQYQQLLEGDEEIPQETLDEMYVWFGEVEEWAVSVLDSMETE